MAKPRLCVGIDIGASSIKLCQLRQTKQGLSVERFGIAPLPRETVVDGSLMNSAAAIAALQELLGGQKPANRRVALAISGNAVIIKKVVLPQMTRDELEDSIAFEAEQLIPYALNEVFLDTQIMGPSATQPGQMDVLLVAAKKEFVNDYTQVVREAGLEPVICDVDAFALENTFLANYETSAHSVALVNVGAVKTNINVLVDAQSVFTRDVSVGGETINQAIQQSLRISIEEAEALKMSQLSLLEAQEPTQPQVIEAIDNAIYQLANEIAHSLDFYAASSTLGPCEQVFISGGSGHVMPLIAALSQRIGVNVERLNPFRKMIPGDIASSALEAVASSASIAVGLALRHAGDTP